jgi:hypothetical protein
MSNALVPVLVHTVIPAKAGTQGRVPWPVCGALGSRLRGNDGVGSGGFSGH